MSMLDRLKDYFPKGTSQKKEPIPEEELRENLTVDTKPEGTTSFNKRNVVISLGVIVAIFVGAMIYGISSASNAKAKKAANQEVETSTSQHLNNLPKGYGDQRNGALTAEEQKKKDKKDANKQNQRKIQDLDDYDSGETHYSSRSVPAYTPVPHYSVPQYTPTPNVSRPAVSGGNNGGMTEAQKIAAQKAKEKMQANQSPISFGLKAEGEK